MNYNLTTIFKRIEDKLQPKDLFFGKSKFDSVIIGDFEDYLICNDYNVVCWHMTRLTDKEIVDIKKNGINADCNSKDFFIDKINELPTSCDCVKKELINHIKELQFTQSEGKVCASFRPIPDDTSESKFFIFTENWGGETIYNYYDNGWRPLPPQNQEIKDLLCEISTPCMIFLRIKYREICETQIINYSCFENIDNMPEIEKKNFIEENSFNIYQAPEKYEVIDVIELC